MVEVLYMCIVRGWDGLECMCKVVVIVVVAIVVVVVVWWLY